MDKYLKVTNLSLTSRGSLAVVSLRLHADDAALKTQSAVLLEEFCGDGCEIVKRTGRVTTAADRR